MKLFAGLTQTDYEDLFRAVGALIDKRGWSNVSLTEVDEGFIMQVMLKPTSREARPRLETYLLTDADLERVLQEAVRRRHKQGLALAAESTSPVPPPSKVVEERPAVVRAYAREPQQRAGALDEAPLPPLPELHGLPDDRPFALADLWHETEVTPKDRPALVASATAAPPYDPGAARAAVVMAHIVAARLRSGVPMGGDDPDLASLLEQVRALDNAGIGQG